MKRFSVHQMRNGIMFLCKLLITASVLGAFLYLITNYYPEMDFWFKGFVIFEVLYFFIYMTFATTYRCFQIGILRLRELVLMFYIAVFLTNFITYFALSLSAKLMLNPVPLLVTTLVQWVVGAILYALSNRLYFALHPARVAIMICAEDRCEDDVLKKFSAIREKYVVQKVCKETEGLEQLLAEIEPYSSVILGAVKNELRMELTAYCFDNNKRLFVVPSVQDIIFHNAHETFVGDSLVYVCRNKTFSLEQLLVKRAMDIFFSLLGIVVTSPIMLLAALIIKLQDGGPVFFRQVRYTRNLKRFTLIKFRSMVENAEANGAQFTVEHDPRITPFGRFLRASRIDELPQFFNILAGDMSFVGPRAERIENVDYYCELMPEFRYRMKVKAGLTGYAQIYGKYNTTYEDKLKLDLLYIENCSLVKDLQLMLLTLRVLIIGDSTEGFEEKTLSDIPVEK